MNKLDLIEALKTETELTKNEASAVVNLFFDEMANALAHGDRVEIRGLCSFYVKKYKAYRTFLRRMSMNLYYGNRLHFLSRYKRRKP
jgi:nucleoid DNA-binding protein